MSTPIIPPLTQSENEYGGEADGTSSGHTLDSYHVSNGSVKNGEQCEQQKQKEHPQKNDPAYGEESGRHCGLPTPVGFWDQSLRKTRITVCLLWARTILILMVFILAVMSLYWAVLFHVPSNMNSLVVYVVDFDTRIPPYNGVKPLVGPLITQITERMRDSNPMSLGYGTLGPARFNNDPQQVRQAVFDWKAWAAIVIMPNATALLQQAVETGNASYDPLGACQVTYVEARDQDTYFDYILPQLNNLETEIISTFGQMWTSMVLRNASIPRTNLQKAPQALNPAIGFSTFSLRPFDPPQTVPSVTIGLIYLIIIAFFSFTFFLPIHLMFEQPQTHPPLKFGQFIIWRWVATMVAYFFMSLAYSLISLAFQIPFSNPSVPGYEVSNNPDAYGKGTFLVFWMINFVGMGALGLACENVASIIGQPWTAMWLIFWVISNVSTSFYAIELSPHFYYWGYAWPLHHIVEASRSVLFDLHSEIGLNFGVLFAWNAVNTTIFPFACYFARWKMQRAEKQEKESKDS